MWRRVWRELSIWGTLLLVLALLGTFAWATHNPDSTVVRAAEEWPWVGPWVTRFRHYYAPPPQEAGPAAGDGGGGVEWEYVVEEPLRPAGMADPGDPDPSRRDAEPGAEKVWVNAGEQVRTRPSDDADLVGLPEVFERLPVLERRGEWVRVATRVGEGWVRADESDEAAYPLGSGLASVTPLEDASPDAAFLRLARELMGVDAPAGRLGPYPYYTDVEPASSLLYLDRLASQVEPAYRSRYGREPRGEAREAVLVFAEEARYRLFQSREEQLSGLPATGHSGRGLVAFYVGQRRRSELAATFVHEMVHVLNRRAVGPALPPWLDEGLAEDLASSRIGPAGDLDPGALGGEVIRGQRRYDFVGAVAALRNLNAAYAQPEPPRLEELVRLDWNGFVRSRRRSLHYDHAAFFIRYLVEGEDGELAPAFRRFLDGVAEGGSPTGEALRRELDRSWEELDAGLAAWVRGKILETTPTG